MYFGSFYFIWLLRVCSYFSANLLSLSLSLCLILAHPTSLPRTVFTTLGCRVHRLLTMSTICAYHQWAVSMHNSHFKRTKNSTTGSTHAITCNERNQHEPKWIFCGNFPTLAFFYFIDTAIRHRSWVDRFNILYVCLVVLCKTPLLWFHILHIRVPFFSLHFSMVCSREQRATSSWT